MRPVLLRMTGFASFRDPAVVDFRGADHFALVGPTGSGKSTVIDAMTFALYGSVPRWDDRRTVALALAPTTARATVALVFDADGTRYVVARELRRTAAGAVNVKEARLERLADPGGTAEQDERTESLATGGPQVTRHVEALLGLGFDDFCTCVVLPQGDFADFLHAPAKERQEKLEQILGLGVYERVKQRANQEASANQQRVELLDDQLVRYADATAEREADAAARVAELVELGGVVTAAAPPIDAAAAELARQQALAERLRAERSRLRALAVPAGVAELDGAHRRGAEAVRAAQDGERAAEEADAAARDALAAGPDRAQLERLRAAHTELAATLDGLPALTASHAAAAAGYAGAAADTGAAHATVEDTRKVRDAARDTAAAAAAQVDRLAADRELLAVPVAPAGVADLDGRRALADAALLRAARDLAAAEDAEARARADADAAPPRGPVEEARRRHAELAGLRERRAAALATRAAATARSGAAASATAAAADRLAAARARLESLRRADVAATLRAGLAVGEDCPVCAQPVATLPPHRPVADLHAAHRDVDAAERDHDGCRGAEGRADAALAVAVAEVQRLDGEIARVTAALSGAVAAAGLAVAAGPSGGAGPGADRDVAGSAADRAGPDAAAPDGVGAAAGGGPGCPEGSGVPVAPVTGGVLDGTADAATDAATGAGTAETLGTVIGAALAQRERCDRAAAAADAAVRTARRARDAAAAEAEAARTAAEDAVARLRAAREPLVALGAPALPDGPLDGWRLLTGWVRAEAAARDDALAAGRAARAAAAAELAAAEEAFAAAGREEARRRQAETVAARAEQEAAGHLGVAQRRVGALRAELAGAPAPAEIDAELARSAELEGRARAAAAALRAARAARQDAERAVADLARRVGAAWEVLRGARDPLVALGAPALDGDALGPAWAALLTWADAAASARDAALADADAAIARACEDRARLAGGLADALAAHGIDPAAVAFAAGPVSGLAGGAGGPGADPAAGPVSPPARGAGGRGPGDAASADTRDSAAPPGREAGGPRPGARPTRDGPGATDAPGAPGAAHRVVAGSAGPAVGPGDAASADTVDTAAPPGTGRPRVLADPARAALAVTAELGTARAVHARVAERRAEADALRADRARAQEEQQVARLLGQQLRSDRFPRWLVASALDALVVDASAILAELSGGQFALTHDRGEFQVVDHADADTRRPVKTLSGGETFQASLALALALSAQMSGLAARGAARLESIFLDEGFGTLDDANLDVVATTLETLAAAGDRMVGVVTHVPALAERVPVRFVVRRDGRTSSIEREDR